MKFITTILITTIFLNALSYDGIEIGKDTRETINKDILKTPKEKNLFYFSNVLKYNKLLTEIEIKNKTVSKVKIHFIEAFPKDIVEILDEKYIFIEEGKNYLLYESMDGYILLKDSILTYTKEDPLNKKTNKTYNREEIREQALKKL